MSTSRTRTRGQVLLDVVRESPVDVYLLRRRRVVLAVIAVVVVVVVILAIAG